MINWRWQAMASVKSGCVLYRWTASAIKSGCARAASRFASRAALRQLRCAAPPSARPLCYLALALRASLTLRLLRACLIRTQTAYAARNIRACFSARFRRALLFAATAYAAQHHAQRMRGSTSRTALYRK